MTSYTIDFKRSAERDIRRISPDLIPRILARVDGLEQEPVPRQALKLSGEDKSFSLVDCLSFAVMERLLIPYAFAFDRHFVQYGVETLE